MSARVFRFLPVVSLLLLCSCASSERMVRMSGGVLDSYSIPEKHRRRSEKFRKMEQSTGSRKSLNEAEPGGDGNLVNLWPFFFRSREYFSILWPLADFDPYGLAIRPFYNQEGDDYSILFPLCAWNTVSKSGWCLLGIWDDESFFFFPLVRHGFREDNDWLYYTPFFIQTWKTTYSPSWSSPVKRKSFTELLLGYGGTKKYVEKGPYQDLFRIFNYYDLDCIERQKLENWLRYRGLPLPKQNETNQQWADRIFAAQPEREDWYAGFFPLFHWERTPDSKSLRLLLLFNGAEGKEGSSWGATPFLGQYVTMRREPDIWGTTRYRETFDAWLLLSRFERQDIPADPERIGKFRDLYNGTYFTQHQRRGTDEIRPEELRSPVIQEKLKELGLTPPETVVDFRTFQMFLSDAVKSDEKSRETVTEYSGGFLPLFDYSFLKDSAFWCIPARISWYDREGKKLSWWCTPVLSGGTSSPEKEVLTIATPLAYLKKTIRKVPGTESYSNQFIHGRESYWPVSDESRIEYENEYALLGLFYRGTDHFLVEKEGISLGAVSHVRDEMNRLFLEKRSLEDWKKRLKMRTELNQAVKTGTRLKELEKLLEEEKIRLDREKLAKEEEKFRCDLDKLKACAKKLSFDLPDDFLKDKETLRRTKCDFLALTTESRVHRDIGNGILWRREEFCNGDSKWNVCSVLAGGETKGDYEYSHILHLLYRHTRKGDRSETLCFPFMAWKEDGEDRDFSFMWRVFHVKTEAGKTGGHILFIPF